MGRAPLLLLAVLLTRVLPAAKALLLSERERRRDLITLGLLAECGEASQADLVQRAGGALGRFGIAGRLQRLAGAGLVHARTHSSSRRPFYSIAPQGLLLLAAHTGALPIPVGDRHVPC